MTEHDVRNLPLLKVPYQNRYGHKEYSKGQCQIDGQIWRIHRFDWFIPELGGFAPSSFGYTSAVFTCEATNMTDIKNYDPVGKLYRVADVDSTQDIHW